MQKRPMRNAFPAKWTLLMLVAFLFGKSEALSQVRDTIDLEQAIATALQNNFDIRIARNDSIVAAVNFSYRNAALYPTLNGTGTVLFNNNSQSQTYSGNITKSRSGIASNNNNFGLSTTWLLFNG